jgi:hypothetical protein
MQHLPQRPQRPPVSDPGADSEGSEPEANRTGGTSQALSNFLYWFIPSPIQQSVVIRRCPRAAERPPDRAGLLRFFGLVRAALLKSRELGSLPEGSDALPAVSTPPFRDKLKDSVDRVTLFGRPLFDPGNQHLIDCRQLLTTLSGSLFPTIRHANLVAKRVGFTTQIQTASAKATLSHHPGKLLQIR